MITSPLTSQNWKRKKTKPFYEAIFSHLEIPEPSFSLRFSIFKYSIMNLKTSDVKTKSETQFNVRYSLFSGKAFANF